ncbi:MAG: STAS domain-containing protein [Terriglobia bacterium]
MGLQMVEKEIDGVTVLKLWGNIGLGEDSRRLREKMNEILTAEKKRVVLDLGDVRYIDSSGLGTLVSVYTSAASQGAKVKLASLTKMIRTQLQITKLVTVFEVHETAEAAVKSFLNQ